MLHGCATQTRSLTHEQIHAVLSAPDRAETDKANDTRRSAAALLRFIDPRPGMQVLELGASGGYTLELMAHAVSATGRVYAQNQGTFMKTVVKDRFAQRLQAYPGRNLSLAAQSFEPPLPASVPGRSMALATFMFVDHDLGWVGSGRARLNRAVFDALKPSDYYIVADHSGRPPVSANQSRCIVRKNLPCTAK